MRLLTPMYKLLRKDTRAESTSESVTVGKLFSPQYFKKCRMASLYLCAVPGRTARSSRYDMSGFSWAEDSQSSIMRRLRLPRAACRRVGVRRASCDALSDVVPSDSSSFSGGTAARKAASSKAMSVGRRTSSRSRLRLGATSRFPRVRLAGTRRACSGGAASPVARFLPGRCEGSAWRGEARRPGERRRFGGIALGRPCPKQIHALRTIVIIITSNVISFHLPALIKTLGPWYGVCSGTGIWDTYQLADTDACLSDTCQRKNSGRFI